MSSIFKPKYPPWGFVSLILIGLAILICFTFLWLIFEEIGISSQRLFNILIFLSLIFWLFFIVLYFTLRYEMRDNYLQLSCGPFSAKIPYNEIVGIKILNLDTGDRLGFLGLALGPVYYINAGYVLMMATGAEKDVLLIMR